MKYSESKALEIQAKYAIPGATLRTWKHRNEIPDKFRAGRRKQIEQKQQKQYEKVKEFLSRKYVNVKTFAALADVPEQTIFDVVRRTDTKAYEMSFQEMKRLQTQIGILKKDCANCNTSDKLIRLLKTRRVHVRLFLDGFTHKEYSHIMNIKTGHQKNRNADIFEKAIQFVQNAALTM